MVPVVRSRVEPNNTHVLWIDEREGSVKIFGASGWEPISGLSEEGLVRLTQIVDNIQESFGDDKSDDIDTFEELRDFLKGFKDNENLDQQIIERIKEYVGESVESISDNELRELLV